MVKKALEEIKVVEIPVSSIDRIIRKGGAERVSKSAITALQKELEEYGVKIARLAWEIASYAGKKTVEDKDIMLALRKQKFTK
ncbi:MAG: histone family protein [Promethearchaeota archaeon]